MYKALTQQEENKTHSYKFLLEAKTGIQISKLIHEVISESVILVVKKDPLILAKTRPHHCCQFLDLENASLSLGRACSS